MRRRAFFAFSLLSLVVLGACSNLSPASSSTPAVATRSPLSVSVFSPVPTATATATPTATPTLTPTPTPALPVFIGTAYPSLAATISAENVAQLKLVAIGGKGVIRQILWSPDGRWIAAMATEGIYMYDASSRSMEYFLFSAEPPLCAAFSQDSRLLAVAFSEKTLKIFQTTDGSLFYEKSDFAEEISGVDFSPDGRMLAIGMERGEVQVWSVGEWRLLRSQKKAASPLKVRFLPDGRRLLFAGFDYQQVWLWDVETDEMRPMAPGNTHGISNILTTQDGRLLVVVGGFFGSITVWQVEEERRILKLPIGEYLPEVAISPDGRMLVVVQGNRMEVWDLNGSRAISKTESPGVGITTLTFSPDGQRLVAGSVESVLYFWRLENGALIGPDSRENPGRAFSIDCSWQGSIWSCFDTVMSSGGEELLAAGAGREVKIWRLPEGTLVQTLKGHQEEVTTVAFSRDGRLLAAGAGTRVIVWDVQTGEVVALLRGHQFYVVDVVFSPDGERLISAGKDGLVRVWRVSDGRLLFDMEKPKEGSLTSLAISSDGQFAAGGTANGVVYLWQTSNGVLLSVIRENKGRVVRLSFFPDGHLLMISFGDTVEIWKVGLGKVELLQTWSDSGVSVLSPYENIAATVSRRLLPDGRYQSLLQLRRASDGVVLGVLPFSESLIGFSSRGDLLITYRYTFHCYGPYLWWPEHFLYFWGIVP